MWNFVNENRFFLLIILLKTPFGVWLVKIKSSFGLDNGLAPERRRAII